MLRVTRRGDAQGDVGPEHEKRPGRVALAANQGGPMFLKHRTVMLWSSSADAEVAKMLGRASSGGRRREAAAFLSPNGSNSPGGAA